MEIVNVALKDNPYNIYIQKDLDISSMLKDVLKNKQDILIVTNDTIAPLYLDKVLNAFLKVGHKVSTCILKDGEAYKTIDSYMQILTKALDENLARDCCFVALGGGVVGDMTGFAAATYQRGVDFIQIPTTLLAMVDSSVGGKTAINHPQGKNMVGAFYQPKAVFIDPNFLKTLPKREISAGMAEVIKYGIIYDRAFFEFLESKENSLLSLDGSFIEKVIKTCCNIKASVVLQDEKEHGLRAILNLGHTFGHAIEAYLGFGTYLHGEAVGLGMVIAAFIAKEQDLIKDNDYLRIKNLISKAQLPCVIPMSMSAHDFILKMHHDKKVASGKIRYVLPVKIGLAEVFNNLDDNNCEKLLTKFKSL